MPCLWNREPLHEQRICTLRLYQSVQHRAVSLALCQCRSSRQTSQLKTSQKGCKRLAKDRGQGLLTWPLPMLMGNTRAVEVGRHLFGVAGSIGRGQGSQDDAPQAHSYVIIVLNVHPTTWQSVPQFCWSTCTRTPDTAMAWPQNAVHIQLHSSEKMHAIL